MKKKLLSLVLVLGLCAGLSAPAAAADASGLDVAVAQAYAIVLSQQIQEKGIRNSLEGYGIAYAGLEDLNADGTPELIIIGVHFEWAMFIGIWTVKNGVAVQTFEGSLGPGADNGRIAFARKNGQVRLFYEYDWTYRAFGGRIISLVDGDGNCERCEYNNEHSLSGDGKLVDTPEEVTYDKTWIVDSTPVFKTENSLQWDYSASQPQAVSALQSALLARTNTAAASTAGTYGTYLIFLPGGYPLSFGAAKVEKKSVQVRDKLILAFGQPTEISNYRTENVVLVTLKAGSSVSMPDLPWDLGQPLEFDGNNQYTTVAEEFLQREMNAEQLKADLARGGEILEDANGVKYIVVYENPTSSGFTDVQSGAYYTDAVTWAVGKGVTAGTSTTTFSPSQTCTTAQILTFLWRASGSPEPTGGNPFSNVSASNYYYKAALWAAQNGMVTGSRFPAETSCNRASAVNFIWQAMGRPKPVAPAGFSDVSQSASYAQAVSWAVGAGVTTGTSASTFSPNTTCTRAQIVTFLYRAMGK